MGGDDPPYEGPSSPSSTNTSFALLNVGGKCK